MIIQDKIPENLRDQAIEILNDAFGSKINAVITNKKLQHKLYGLLSKNKNVVFSYDKDKLKGILIFYKIRDRIHIDMLAVCKNSRGEGIGTALINHISKLATQRECKYLSLDVIDINLKAKKLYESVGFKEYKVIDIYPFNKIFKQEFRKVYKMKMPIG